MLTLRELGLNELRKYKTHDDTTAANSMKSPMKCQVLLFNTFVQYVIHVQIDVFFSEMRTKTTVEFREAQLMFYAFPPSDFWQNKLLKCVTNLLATLANGRRHSARLQCVRNNLAVNVS